MQKLVVDSSVIVKWLNQQDEENLEFADQIMSDVQNHKVTLLAPELAKYEVGNALLVKKKISLSEARTSLATLCAFPIQFINLTEDLANETYRIAGNTGVTFYDASFMALADQEDATLVTENIKHQGKDSDIKVVSLKDY